MPILGAGSELFRQHRTVRRAPAPDRQGPGAPSCADNIRVIPERHPHAVSGRDPMCLPAGTLRGSWSTGSRSDLQLRKQGNQSDIAAKDPDGVHRDGNGDRFAVLQPDDGPPGGASPVGQRSYAPKPRLCQILPISSLLPFVTDLAPPSPRATVLLYQLWLAKPVQNSHN